MDKALKSLRQRVADLLQKEAREDTITWRGPVVWDQDILSDEPPSKYHGGPSSVPIPKKEYAKILAEWKKNFIGGTKSWDDHERCRWTPPKGSKLVYLTEDLFCRNFYLLFLEDGRWVFLQKIDGDPRRSLLVIEGDEISHEELEPAIFVHTLKKALEKKSAT